MRWGKGARGERGETGKGVRGEEKEVRGGRRNTNNERGMDKITYPKGREGEGGGMKAWRGKEGGRGIRDLVTLRPNQRPAAANLVGRFWMGVSSLTTR